LANRKSELETIMQVNMLEAKNALSRLVAAAEDVYLKGYATMGELMVGLSKYFAFNNGERPHQYVQLKPGGLLS